MRERLKGLWQFIVGIGGLLVAGLFVMAFLGMFDKDFEEIGEAEIFRGNDTKSAFAGESTLIVTEDGEVVGTETTVEDNSDESISAIIAGEYVSTSDDTNAIITITDDGYMGISFASEMYDFDRAELIDDGDGAYQANGCGIVYTVTFYEDGLFLYNDEVDFLIGFFKRVD